MSIRMLKAGLLAAAATLALTAAASAQIKVGSVLSVTGPASFLGDPEKRTLEMYVEALNAKGGINGQKIELKVYDDAGDANAARTFATRLVEEDKVAAVIGGSTTGSSMAMIPVFEDARIPFISLAGAVQIVSPVKKFTFKTPHTDLMACEKIFADLKQRNLLSIAMISGTDGFGASMKTQCEAAAPKAGIAIIHQESFGPRDTDMTPQLTNIKGKTNVQAVVVPGFSQGPAAKTAGTSAPVASSNAPSPSRSHVTAGSAAAAGPEAVARSATAVPARGVPEDEERRRVGTRDRIHWLSAGEPTTNPTRLPLRSATVFTPISAATPRLPA